MKEKEKFNLSKILLKENKKINKGKYLHNDGNSTLSLSFSLTLFLSLSHSLFLSHTLTFSLTITFSHSFSHSHSISLSCYL